MINNLNNCEEYSDKRTICVAEENKMKYSLNNKSGARIQKIKVDGCLGIKGQQCDYLFRITPVDSKIVKRNIFVELKGAAIPHAISQVLSTVEVLSKVIKGSVIDARIVGKNSAPRYNETTSYRKLSAIILPTGGKIFIKTRKHEEYC